MVPPAVLSRHCMRMHLTPARGNAIQIRRISRKEEFFKWKEGCQRCFRWKQEKARLTTRGQKRLGITEISEQARMQAGQLAGLDDGELIAGGVQHMQSMAKTEAIRIEVGLQG